MGNPRTSSSADREKEACGLVEESGVGREDQCDEPQGTGEDFSASGSDDETQRLAEKDELFDEHADSEDEEWVRDALLGGSSLEENSDAISCPSCFAQLSLQCQQHLRYQNQFRALYVLNCRVATNEVLRAKARPVGGCGSNEEVREAFQPVSCAKCGTRVGVLDAKGVYHFFNVIY